MPITDDVLYQIIADMWTTTLGFQVETLQGLAPPNTGELTVTVGITGAWEGEVRLKCPLALARLIAAAIFQVAPESIGRDDMIDALSELVHIVGGNLKTFLPRPVMLSLPTVSDHAEPADTNPEWQLLSRLTLASHSYPFVITLLGTFPPVTQAEPPADSVNPSPHGAL